MKQLLNRFDQSVTGWIASTFGPSLRPFFEYITMLGDPFAIISITIAVIVSGVLSGNTRLALSGGMIIGTVLTGALLKMLFERARPLTEYAMNMKLQTFSFPSGHSSGSMIAFGLLAYIAYHQLPQPFNVVVALLLLIVPLLVGMSRVYLGAHFPTDVIAGWLLGIIGLLIVIYIIRPFA